MPSELFLTHKGEGLKKHMQQFYSKILSNIRLNSSRADASKPNYLSFLRFTYSAMKVLNIKTNNKKVFFVLLQLSTPELTKTKSFAFVPTD